MFKELDMMIQDHCLIPNGPDDNDVDDVKYDALKAEINAHIQGEKEFLDLSPEAQEIMEEWERYENELKGQGYKNLLARGERW